MTEIHIYCDGGCSPNPGVGGWGTVILIPGTDHRLELSGNEEHTTNNRMEIFAVIQGMRKMENVPRSKVTIHSDSKYVCDAFAKNWISNWQKNGWKTADKKDVQNPDLWKELIALVAKHDVSFTWVKGHAGNVENERCDQLATEARLEIRRKKLLEKAEEALEQQKNNE